MSEPGGLVAGAVNFRDVGGLPAGGRANRSGALFPSGNLGPPGGRTPRRIALPPLAPTTGQPTVPATESLLETR